MKSNWMVVGLLILMVILNACTVDTSSSSSISESQTGEDQFGELPMTAELLIGTLKLEGTENEVNGTQAEQLLPLWQLMKSLSTSDTAVQEELDTVVEQIHKTMTPGQLDAIEAMQLSQQDILTTMQELGLVNETGAGSWQPPEGFEGMPPEGFPDGNLEMPSNDSGDGQGSPRDFPGGGQGMPPAGSGGGQGMPGFYGSQGIPSGGYGEGQMQGGEDGLSPEIMATAQARRAGGGGFMRMLEPLMEALIEYLEAQS